MNAKIIFVFVALFAFTQAANFMKLEAVEPQPMCSITDLLGCVEEIENAFADCSNAADIMVCIEDILGASHCIGCVCDVIGC